MAFSKKAAEIRRTLQTDYGEFKVHASKKASRAERDVKPCKHSCTALEVKLAPMAVTKKTTRESLLVQTPIIIERKSQAGHVKSASARHYLTDRKSSVKKVEPFVPIQVPTRDRNKLRMGTEPVETSGRRRDK